jgi:hypothetical protein
MENFCVAVIPAQAGIHWLRELGDPCLRRDDGKLVFLDTLQRGEAGFVSSAVVSWRLAESNIDHGPEM